MRTLSFYVGNEYDNKEVLHYLRGCAGLSVRLIRSLKQFDNGILLNDIHARTVDKIKAGDKITINIPDDDIIAQPSEHTIFVMYEDEDIIVVDKPALLPMHPSHNHQGDTLANAVSWHLAKEGKGSTFRAIGRLDKGTSGIVICALNSFAAAKLSGKIKKEYTAIATGVLQGKGTIDKPIFRPDPIKTLRAVGEEGDRAVTHWQVVGGNDKMTILKVNLETGRTHQIRVHFSYMGNALVGDRMYGEIHPKIERQALHCSYVEFEHPITGKMLKIDAKLPQDMEELLSNI
ncbi:MAG: RluA family pseudouridine synthase [Clostridia bacterium]|nr:RluA family pseudouridine synthase [Clostridia bacterium]